jgi:YidC/Oxa1 family membrane protein insertase
MDNKRYLLALALSMGVILLWMKFVLPTSNAPKPSPVGAPTSAGAPLPGEAPAATSPTEPGPEPKAAEHPQAIDVKEEATGAEEKSVETDLFRIRVSNRGARILSWQLKKYQDDNGKPLELVSLASSKLNRFPLDLEFEDEGLTKKVSGALFVMEIPPSQGDGNTRITFKYSSGDGLQLSKELVLSPSSYVARLRLEAHQGGQSLRPRVLWGAGFGTETGLPPANGDRNDITQVAFSREGSVTHRRRENFKTAHTLDEPGPVLWAGLEDHYFTGLVLPDKGASSIQLRLDQVIEEGREKQFLSVALQAPDAESFQVYAGPKDRQLLASLNLGLEGIVNYGFLPGIAQALFFLLRHITEYTTNWGISIILLTMLIRLAFFPLTHKGSISMRRTQEKMKKIQPRIENIKKKYRAMKRDMGNRQKMNEEIMALYAKEGMNPLAGMTGCFPLLLQLPILWGFYNLLVNAIELRHAPFGFWITDLSKRDPYYITPIVMGATMLIQQALTGSSIPDPTQRRIMMIMPLMFTWFFKDLPSGLVLYWLVNNILGIGQQYLINRQVTRETAVQNGAGG